MKNFSILFFGLMALCFVACQDAANSETGTAAEATTNTAPVPADASTFSGVMPVNLTTSMVEWKGSNPTGGHVGTVQLQAGELTLTNGSVTGGKFVLDMNSLAATDVEGEDKANLEGHLKDTDFFEVAKHPTGSFEIQTIEPLTGDVNGSTHTIIGNLTLKGISKPIRIPARLTVAGSRVMAETPEFAINRTEWGITYKSGIIGTLKDKIIDDFVKLKVRLEANAQVGSK